eukprot:14257492-Ditylum_brightwellii.AAC.1
MIICNISSESPLSEAECTQVSASDDSSLKQSGNKPLTTPTCEPTTSAIPDELLLMMSKLQANMAKCLQELKEEEIMSITEFMMEISVNTYSNEVSLKKIKSNLNSVTQTVSKLDHRLYKEQESYIEEQKAINTCITEAESHVQNNKAIISNFDEKLDKAILGTKQ